MDNVFGGKQIQSGVASVRRTHHCEGLARTCLSIGETGSFGAFEGFADKGHDAFLIDVLIIRFVPKGIVKREKMLFDVFGQVHFKSKQKEEGRKIRQELEVL